MTNNPPPPNLSPLHALSSLEFITCQKSKILEFVTDGLFTLEFIQNMPAILKASFFNRKTKYFFFNFT